MHRKLNQILLIRGNLSTHIHGNRTALIGFVFKRVLFGDIYV